MLILLCFISGACDLSLMASQIVPYTVHASSSLDADHATDTVILGTLPTGPSGGYYRPDTDAGSYVEVSAIGMNVIL